MRNIGSVDPARTVAPMKNTSMMTTASVVMEQCR